jgi:hypothetical protein
MVGINATLNRSDKLSKRSMDNDSVNLRECSKTPDSRDDGDIDTDMTQRQNNEYL